MKKLLVALIILPFISSAQWQPSVVISAGADTAGLNENMASCLAASGDTLHVVWCDHRTTGSSIYYTHSLDTGINWSPAIPITDTNGSATFPAIAVSGSTVHVAWMDLILGQRASFYRRSLDGGNTWGAIICLDSVSAFWPGLAASGSLVVMSINKLFAVGNTEVYFRRSIDNGTTWDSLQQISNGNGRSEDPAVAALGSHVHLSWNDNRNGTMQIYYRYSSDAGLNWNPEVPLTNAVSPNTCYTSMVCLNGTFVDVPYGYNTGNFDVWLRQSADSGATFSSAQQLSNASTGELYPFMTRDSTELHLVYIQTGTGVNYLHSADGGVTWDPPFLIGAGGQPYIAYTGCVLHVIWVNSHVIYYMRNPTGNGSCLISAIPGLNSAGEAFSVYPNPAGNELKIEDPQLRIREVEIYNLPGEKVFKSEISNLKSQISVDVSQLLPGVYFIKATDEKNNSAMKKMIKL
jgi:hypothetical protein